MAQPKLCHFRPSEYLFKEGAQSRSLFLITKGTISVRKRRPGGEVELARIYANEVVGELSLFDKGQRVASAIALSEVDALEIEYDSLQVTLKTMPNYLRAIIIGIVTRLKKADDTIGRLQKNFAEEVSGGDSETSTTSDDDAASILAATDDIDFDFRKNVSKTEANQAKDKPEQAEDVDESDIDAQLEDLKKS